MGINPVGLRPLVELENDCMGFLEGGSHAFASCNYDIYYGNIHGISTVIFNVRVYSPANKHAILALDEHTKEGFGQRSALVG